ncbi:uncharacterized protein LOC125042329 [Penaeus chinensis]|uniref:uncharacterized protein LOC125042329 n=1 Tax=Penaeus chinensis TaxID=139456 RepID=UPI001FB6F88D|nr:uncharacterized protein LOC125042329 [Penaeus chinensis]
MVQFVFEYNARPFLLDLDLRGKSQEVEGAAKTSRVRGGGGVRRQVLLLSLVSLALLPCAGALDCFRCGSFNGSDPHCDDPFHFNYSSHYLASPCLAGWKNRNGLYPSTHCIKLSGYFYQTSEQMVVRSCTIDSGTLTTDTELGRQSHCGMFTYDGKTVVGCLESCNSFDACNISAAPLSPGFLFISSLHMPAVTDNTARRIPSTP